MNFNKYLVLHGKTLTSFKTFYKHLKMSWRSVGSNNKELITQLKGKCFINYQDYINCNTTYIYFVEYGVVASASVEAAMIATDRKFYSPHNPYVDAPQNIGCGVTISAPHMVIFLII